jgi:hypothetical protein
MLKAVEALLGELSEPDGEALLEALVFVRCECEPGATRWSGYQEVTGTVALAAYLERKHGPKRPDARHTRVISDEQRRREEDEYLEDLARRQKKFGPR